MAFVAALKWIYCAHLKNRSFWAIVQWQLTSLRFP